MFYAIVRKRDGNFVTATDCNVFPHQQMCYDPFYPPLIFTDCCGNFPEKIDLELRKRGIDKKFYKVVPVEIKVKGETMAAGRCKGNIYECEITGGKCVLLYSNAKK